MRPPRDQLVGFTCALLAVVLLAVVLGMAAVKVGLAQMVAVWWVLVLLSLPAVWATAAVWLARGCGRAVRRLAAGAAGVTAGTMALVAVQTGSEFGYLSPRARPLTGTAVGWVMAPAIGLVLAALGAAAVGRWRRPAEPDSD